MKRTCPRPPLNLARASRHWRFGAASIDPALLEAAISLSRILTLTGDARKGVVMATVILTIEDKKIDGKDAVEITTGGHIRIHRYDTLTKGQKIAALLMKIAGLLLED